jgi:hypothetical protein
MLSTDGQGCRPVGYLDTLTDAVLLFHRALAPVVSAFSTEAESFGATIALPFRSYQKQ